VIGRSPVPEDTLSRVLVVVGVALLAVGLIVGAIAPAAGVSGFGQSGVADTSRQDNPQEVSNESDLSSLQQRLADRLARRAESGAVNVSSGDIGEARERLNGTEYESLLDQYSAVSNETGSTEETVAYRRMLELQSEFVTMIDEYWTAHERYQSVRNVTFADGRLVTRPDATAEREREAFERANRIDTYRQAHRLARIAVDVNETGARLIDQYRRLGDLSERNFTTARRSVGEAVTNVTATQERVTERTFTDTAVRITDRTQTASYSDPLRVEGVVTANWSAVPNATVRLSVGNETVETTTDPDGSFQFRYQPTFAATSDSRVTVRYVPANDSANAPAAASFGVTLRQQTPTVTVTATPREVSYGETFLVAGRVSVDRTGIEGTPYTVLVGGQVVGQGETGPAGRYAVSRPLPSTVANGTQAVRVLLPVENRALASTSANTTVRVLELGTNLSLDSVGVDDQTVRVRGTLSSVEGTVANQTVDIAINGTTVGTVETGANGSFATAVAVPDAVLDSGLFGGTVTVAISASYGDASSNLGPSEAVVTRTVSAPGRPAILGGLGAAFVVLVVGTLLARRVDWRSRWSLGRSSGPDDDGDTGRDTPAAFEDADPQSLLATARDALTSDPDTAVRVGYAALRRRVERESGASGDGRTHWEFYRDCREAGLDEATLTTLRSVTERYERVAYAADGVTAETARTTLEEVESLVDGSPSPDRDVGD
jgi:hypothetical protein